MAAALCAGHCGARAADIEELRRRLARLLGVSGGLAIEQTDLLVPESSGKFRLGYPAARDR